MIFKTIPFSTRRFVIIQVLFLNLAFIPCFAQDNTKVKQDSAAFHRAIYWAKKGQHDKAKNICQAMLKKQPHDVKTEVLLGRLYAWDKQFDSARIVLKEALSTEPSNQEALEALVNVELWSGQYDQALTWCNKALSLYPNSESLLIKKAKIYNKQAKYKDASKTVEQVLRINPANQEAIQFKQYLQKKMAGGRPGNNAVGVSWSYDRFNNGYTPWNFGSLYYFHKGHGGALSASVNYANRFQTPGMQYELNLYPRISSSLRGFIGGAYSKDSVFPAYNLGAGLAYKLFRPVELEAGGRYLNFSGLPDPIIIYTGAVNVSFHRVWTSVRTYLNPQQTGMNQSYYLTARYYMKNPENNITLIVGTGLSPHDYVDSISGKTYNYPTKSNRVRIAYQTAFLSPQNLLKCSLGYEKRAYYTGAPRERISMGLGIERWF